VSSSIWWYRWKWPNQLETESIRLLKITYAQQSLEIFANVATVMFCGLSMFTLTACSKCWQTSCFVVGSAIRYSVLGFKQCSNYMYLLWNYYCNYRLHRAVVITRHHPSRRHKHVGNLDWRQSDIKRQCALHCWCKLHYLHIFHLV